MSAATQALPRPLPHYLEAERCVLGAILLHNEYLVLAIEKGLKSDDFFLKEHRLIFDAMIRLDDGRKPIDLITIIDDLRGEAKLEEAGGAAYLAQLIDGIPHIINVEYYAEMVREKALLRNLIHAAEAIQLQAFEASESVESILDHAESSVFRLAEDRVRVGLIGIKDMVRDSFERLEKIFTEGKRVTGISTGYAQLDNLTSGLQPSELIILASRPSMGKTSLALNIAENVALHRGEPVAIFSLEMSKESLLQRLLASQARIDSHKFRTGHLGREDWRRMTEALARLSEAPLWIDDTGSATIAEMGAKARRLKRDKKLSLVIVDYLQLIAARGRFGNRNEEVSSITRGLKGLAKELQLPVLVLSQLTRAPEREDRRPQLADLRESGAIEQDADVVFFISRPNAFKPGETPEERAKTELIIAKQRNGPTDRVNFVFLSQFTRFEEAAPDTWTQE